MAAALWQSLKSDGGRWALAGALAAYTALALASGLDRMAPQSPGQATLRGLGYGAGAALAGAGEALREGRPAEALALAAHALRANPVDTHVVGTYATALLRNGQAAAADRAFRVSGALGWRDDPTQIYWFAQGLKLGDAPLAARHLDALLRQNPVLPDRDRYLATLLTYDEGRSALAEQLRARPDWAYAFITLVDPLGADDLAARADTVRRTGRGAWACADSGPLVDRLVDAELYAEAAGVMRTTCPDNGRLPRDGGLEHLDGAHAANALDWNVTRRGDILTVPGTGPTGQRRLGLSVTAVATTAVLWQRLVIPPATYHLTWQMPDTASGDAAALLVTLACTQELDDARSGQIEDHLSSRYGIDLTVAPTCPAPILTFWLQPNHPVNLAAISLTRR